METTALSTVETFTYRGTGRQRHDHLANITDAAGMQMQITEGRRSCKIANPTVLLVIAGGAGNDTITITSVDPALHARLSVSGDNIDTRVGGTQTDSLVLTAAAGQARWEFDGASEVQRIAITGSPTGGTFTLTFGGSPTTAIAWNAGADAVQAALEALATIGAGNVLVTGGPGTTSDYLVTFAGTLGGTDQPLLTASASGLTGGASPAVRVTSPDVQWLRFSGGANGGTFTLSFKGATTLPLALGATAAVVQAALQGLLTIGSGNATVIGGPGPTAYGITLATALSGPTQPDVVVCATTRCGTGIGLTGFLGSNPRAKISSDSAAVSAGGGVTVPSGTQTVTVDGTPDGGTFKLTFNGLTTTSLQWNATSSAVQTALAGLATIGSGSVTVSGGRLAAPATLGAALVTTAAITTLTVAALASAIASGTQLVLDDGVSTQKVVTDGLAAAGATTITVASFTPSKAWASGTSLKPMVSQYVVTFAGTMAGRDQPAMTATSTGVSGSVAPTVTVEKVEGFALSFIDFDQATAGAGQTTLSGPNWDTPWTLKSDGTVVADGVTFTNIDYIDAGEATDTLLGVGAATWRITDEGVGQTSVVDEAQTVTIAGTPTGGTFTLSFGSATTSGLSWNSLASAVQTALEALSTIGAGNVLVTGGPGPGTPTS